MKQKLTSTLAKAQASITSRRPLKAKVNDCHDNLVIELNTQAEQILSPDKTLKLLACDGCDVLDWKKLNTASFLCPACYELHMAGNILPKAVSRYAHDVAGHRRIKAVAAEHEQSDLNCGRDWECSCSDCNLTRKDMLKDVLKKNDGRWTAAAESLSQMIIDR